MRRIGIFGGTFNPIHNGHLAVAYAAYKQLKLDFVIFMTGGNPPHKRDGNILDAGLRHIMVKRAVRDKEYFIPCDWEVKRKEYSYSVNTLNFLKKIYPCDKLYFIIGGDSLADFDKWYHPAEICSLCTLAVYNRGGSLDVCEVEGRYNAEIEVIGGEYIDISSTAMRSDYTLLEKNTPPAVWDFIKKYGLYQMPASDMDILSKLLKPSRLQHSIGVAEFASELAKIYGADMDKAYRTGLLHDAAKNIAHKDAVIMCDELEADLDSIERNTPALVHPKLGAELVKCLFGVHEGEMTSAIRCHTVGKLGMSLLDKIIFVADMCEKGRCFEGVDKIRNSARQNLDEAVLMCIDSTISFNTAKNNPIHPMAYAVRGELLKNL